MKNNFLFVANFKMNLPFKKSIEFVTSHYDDFVALTTQGNHKIVLCPSFEGLFPIVEMFKETPMFVGAQNCSSHTHGAFTGQVGPQSLHDVGCTFCIVGHSESRKEFGESDDKIAQKCIHLLDYDITPILCVGETQEEHKNGKTLEVLKAQLAPLFDILNTKTTVHPYLTPYIAYEPIWSIGTGCVAKLDQLDMVYSWLVDHIQHNSPKIPWKLLYGGSVTPENSDALKKLERIDGFLIGGASLDFERFKQIVE